MRLSDAEWKVMQVLWDRGPCTARDVLDGVAGDPEWAYTTVKTMLDRLVVKKAVRRERADAAGVYAAVLSRDAARRTAVEGLLDRAFDGAFGPLLRFAAEGRSLSAGERRALREILDREEDRRGDRRRGRGRR